ncbi:MAG: MerR family transcriptional regulator [Clostridia bacterium]|nr:MerR family transcriptional regulator [Clostridia bacterium]
MPKPKVFTTSEIAVRADLPESTVRYYAQEFENYLQVPRSKAGYRKFNDGHFQKLLHIKKLIKDEGLSIKQVHQRLDTPSLENYANANGPKLELVAGSQLQHQSQTLDSLEELLSNMDLKTNQRLAELEQAILMMGPVLRQIREDNAINLQLQDQKLEMLRTELDRIREHLHSESEARRNAESEASRRTDELLSAWREQHKAQRDVAVALEKISTQPKKGFLAKIFG